MGDSANPFSPSPATTRKGARPATVYDNPADRAYNGPDFDREQFFGAFWSMDENFERLDRGFTALRDYLSQGNDYLGEVVSVLKERFAHIACSLSASIL